MASGSSAGVCSGPWPTPPAIAHKIPPSIAPARRAGGAPEPRDAARARLGRGGPGQPQRGRAPRRHPARPPHGEEGVAGRLAAARHHPDGPHDAVGRRHAGPRAAALRQGAPAGARRPARGAGRAPSSRSGSARSASTTASSATAVEALEGSGIPVAAVSTGFPGRALAVPAAARRRSARRWPPAPRRSTSSSPAPTC